MAKGNAALSARAIMNAGVSAAPPTAPTATSPLVQSLNQLGNGMVSGRGAQAVMPRPPGVFETGAFGPGTPLWPMTIDFPDPETDTIEPRRTQYPVFWNFPVGTPGSEGLGKMAPFGVLRTLADEYNIARRCIEARKKEILGLAWDIVPTPQAAEAMKGSISAKTDWEKRKSQVMEFMMRPDRSPDSPYDNWAEWMEVILEDRYVIDAVALYLHPPLGGPGSGVMGSNIGSLDVIDGSTMRPLYDLRGGTPPPSSPAFQQFLWGVPRTDYATPAEGKDPDELNGFVDAFKYRELKYLTNVKRDWTPYGFSPVEQALLPIQIGLARQRGQLQWFTEGSVPYLYVVPGNELIQSPQQVRQLQNALNSIAGDQAWKQKIIVLPPGSDMKPIKDPTLSDNSDEFFIGLTTMHFGMSPQDLGIIPKLSGVLSAGSGRALANANNQNSQDHWLEPETNALAIFHNWIIQGVLKQVDMMFSWTGLDAPQDESQLAQDAIGKVNAHLISIDEGRTELGLEPYDADWSQVPVIIAADGTATPLPQAIEEAAWEFEQAQKNANLVLTPWVPMPPAPPGAPGGQPAQPGQPPNAPAPVGSSAAAGDKDESGNATTPMHEAAENVQDTKPKPPGSAKAQLAELEAMRRVLTKGRAFEDFEPRSMSPAAYGTVKDNLVAKGIDQAIDLARAVTMDEHRRYVADLVHSLVKGVITQDFFDLERGRLVAEGVVFKAGGRDDTPSDAVDTERLMAYWSEGEGRAKLNWGVDGDFDRCRAELGKYVHEPHELAGLCANLHHRATGAWPGHAPGESESHSHKGVLTEDGSVQLPPVALPEGFKAGDTIEVVWEHDLPKALSDTRLVDVTDESGHPDDMEPEQLAYHLHHAHRVDGPVPTHRADLENFHRTDHAEHSDAHSRTEGYHPMGHDLEGVTGVEKVGPKGYIHGWIFVGVPGEGDAVRHPDFGTGKVSRVRELGNGHASVSVRWDSGDFTSHDAIHHEGGSTFVPREEHERVPEPPAPPETDAKPHVTTRTPEDIEKDAYDTGMASGADHHELDRQAVEHRLEARKAQEAGNNDRMTEYDARAAGLARASRDRRDENPNSEAGLKRLEDQTFESEMATSKTALEHYTEAYGHKQMANVARRAQGSTYSYTGVTHVSDEEKAPLKVEENRQNALSRGKERAGRQKDLREGATFLAEHPEPRPAQGWKKLTKQETSDLVASRSIKNGTSSVKAIVAAKKYSDNHEMHLLHDGSVVSVKSGSIPAANRASDLKDVLDSTAELRALYPEREPHHVSVGDSVNGRFGPWVFGNAYAGQSKIGISPHVFTDGRNSAQSGAAAGHWMAESANHSTARVVIAHEFGHTIDDEGAMNGARSSRERVNALLAAQRAGTDISKYGHKNTEETYAEAFSEWHLSKGMTSNPTVQSLAQQFGWKK